MATLTPSQKISPCLWFNDNAEEAAKFYVSIFKNSRVLDVTRYSEAGREHHGRPPGSVMTVDFELDGQSFMGLNGGPMFKFTEAVSFMVWCDTQAEIDEYWQKLTANGGHEVQCGWLTDRFGLSWQVVPSNLRELLTGPNSGRVMTEVMKMVKLDIARMNAAGAGR